MPVPLRPTHVPGIALADLQPDLAGRASGITLDSRAVVPGDLYVALPGLKVHGARFAASAVGAGAVAVLTDADGAALAGELQAPVVVVDDPRGAMGDIAASIYGRPTTQLEMFGLTGTNGKTSTVFLLEAALAACGRSVATIGTIGFRVDGEPVETGRGTVTTPDAPDLQAMLAYMIERGASAVAMEVSSHALALHRVDAIGFDVAAFTMFGQDHLDFHPTLDDYFEAKSRLFLGGRCRKAVVNADDPWGRKLIALIESDARAEVITTGVESDADYRVLDSRTDAAGVSHVRAKTPAGEVSFVLNMLGDFNVRNALTALAMCGAAGLDLQRAASGLAAAQVPGRMQRVELGPDRPHVIVDFAHTPQAVAAALGALPAGGRRIAVLGAGGDRDPLKRPLMGRAAAENADVVVVTDDNPRTEDPTAIRAVVRAGAEAASRAEVIDGGDRRSAIATALELAAPGDWIAIMGKGHERGQTIGDTVTPFDDVEVVTDLTRRN